MQHLLYLTHRIPYPPNKGDKLRSYHLLQQLLARYRVHLGTFVDDPHDWAHADALRRMCGESRLVRLQPAWARIRSLRALATGEAMTLPYYRDAALQSWVDDVMIRYSIKHVVVFSSAMAQYVSGARNARRIADLVDVDSDKWLQYAAKKSWPLSAVYRRESATLLSYERKIAREFDATVLVSKAEAALFKRLVPEASARISHANNGVDADYFSPERDYANPYRAGEHVVVFTGAMDYWPNVDAVDWFAREVFPEILAGVGAARFYVVGGRPAPAVRALAKLPGVVVTGGVPDIRPYLAHAELAVAPLRVARGIQNKVLEGMAMARLVIVSPEAMEGLEAIPGKELLVASGATEFAALVRAALQTDQYQAFGPAARRRVLSDYSWERNLGRFNRLLKGLRVLSSVDAGSRTETSLADKSSSRAP